MTRRSTGSTSSSSSTTAICAWPVYGLRTATALGGRWGALVVKDKMIISDGYNGTPSGFENVCEDENNVTKPYVLHAEANAITKLARSGNNSDGSTLYVTASPCIECAKLIIQAGIKRVVYGEKYRLSDGIDLLKRAKIETVYLNPDENINDNDDNEQQK